MREIKEEIVKEIYEDYLAMPPKEREKRIRCTIPDEWEYGYGYYGYRLAKEHGKYYIVHRIGGNCD